MNQDTAANVEQRFRLGLADYVWTDGELRDAAGRPVPLRAKSLKMFAALLAHQGRVLTKDQLSDLVWPETVATDESIARCVADIRKALKDDALKIIQTFPKRGYRLNATVHLRIDGPGPQLWARKGAGFLLVVLIALAVILARPMLEDDTEQGIVSTPSKAPITSLREAVAILPFAANSDSDRFLASGLLDDLEIHLAEMSAIKLVSRGQVSVVANTQQGPVALARSLDVRYIVDGNFREDSGTIALSLRLIDGSDGTMLWADRYEGTRAGLMVFRDTLPEALVGAMSIELNARDRQRLAMRDTDDPVAFEEAPSEGFCVGLL